MKFIEIQKGQAINIDSIVYFEESENGIRVHCTNGSYFDAAVSFDVLKQLVNSASNNMSRNLEILASKSSRTVL